MWIWILLIVLLVIVLLLCLASWFFFKLSILREKVERSDTDFLKEDNPTWHPFREQILEAQAFMRREGEIVHITSYDGLKLAAFQIPAKVSQPKGTLVVFHGYRSLATVDFAPEVLFLHELGYHLLVPYQRSHGLSEGKHICYGNKERYDARDWAKYAAKTWPGLDIFLAGISMGSATVMMAADLELPETVRGIVADCGFTSAYDIMSYLLKAQYHLPNFPMMNLEDLYCRLMAGYSLKEGDARKSLANSKLPVLFLHGAEDDFVPVYMSDENYAACAGEKELYKVKGASHAQSFAIDPQGCQEKMTAFFEKYGTV